MKYLESTLKFLGRFYILALPLYILSALPSLIGGVSTMGNYSKLMKELMAAGSDPMRMQDPTMLIGLFSGLFAAAAGTGIVAFILTLIITPATHGMINKALATNHADLNDFVPSLKDNIVKYIIFLVGSLVLWLVFGIAVFVIFLIFGLITAVIKWLGILLIILGVIGTALAAITLGICVSLWFPAMVADNLDVMSALKKSIEVAKGSFWTLLGITLLVWLVSAVAGGVLGLFGLIPVKSFFPAIKSYEPQHLNFR